MTNDWQGTRHGRFRTVASVASESDVARANLFELRTTNVALVKERDELKQRFAGIDPDEVKTLAEEKRRLEEAQQLKAGEVEKMVENRIKGLKGDWEKQLSAATTERDALNTRLVAIQIDQGVITTATKRGLRSEEHTSELQS